MAADARGRARGVGGPPRRVGRGRGAPGPRGRALGAGADWPWGAAAAPLAAEAQRAPPRADVIGAAYSRSGRQGRRGAAQSDQVALEACRARGWVYRAQEATLVPRPPAPAAPAFESFEQLAQLTRIATHLTA